MDGGPRDEDAGLVARDVQAGDNVWVLLGTLARPALGGVVLIGKDDDGIVADVGSST